MKKNWRKNILEKRKQYVITAEHDVQFAKDQIAFWKKHLTTCEKYLKETKRAVADWEKGMQP